MSSKTNDKSISIIKIRATDDIEINGNIYFIPDKYLENKFLSYEYKKLYKLIIVLYLDLQITNHKIENIKEISKLHINNGIISADKIISYILCGKLYISHLTTIEKCILDKIPDTLISNINLNIIEKI